MASTQPPATTATATATTTTTTATTSTTTAGRYADTARVVGGAALQQLHAAKVLVVGAGGIGCELLKNLVMTGFHNIEVIDLDTIDLSNLNRQFLFRREHIDKSKAEVARETVASFNPHAKIVAHHGNIKEERFGVEYFKGFVLVFMALDNLEARKHVNRLCLAADVPAVESGTRGYIGQVQVIKKGVSECYECVPKQSDEKSYPVCTIRNTPSKPIHCIVWAKEKFRELFSGITLDEEEDEEAVQDNKDADSVAKDPEILRQDELLEAEKKKGFAQWLFRKLFYRDTAVRLRMGELFEKDLWKGRRKPQPIACEDGALEEAADGEEKSSAGLRDMRVLSLREHIEIFLECASKLFTRAGGKVEQFNGEVGAHIQWDKDDEEVMRLVAAASNIRSHSFHIPVLSHFDVKSMAGKIVPAIATSNAVVAGIMVLEAYKLLCKSIEECKFTWLLRKPSGQHLLLASNLEPPNKKCFVCSNAAIKVAVNTKTRSVAWFAEHVLGKHLSLNSATICVGNRIWYEPAEGLEEDELADREQNGKKTLAEIGLADGGKMSVSDDTQEVSWTFEISHTTDFDHQGEEDSAEGVGPCFSVSGALEHDSSIEGVSASGMPPVDEDNSDIVEVNPAGRGPLVDVAAMEEEEEAQSNGNGIAPAVGQKRARGGESGEGGDEPSAKRQAKSSGADAPQ
eukprot:TRINITY_DN2180_c0_g1_i3.p1 TRINITY_DN2180_c0_g1~~TRINITY_DN2180_c0_g1_i3.p1  ORF type:complete len:684 (+),score=206.25 TRINITY_DN2180_c0_g1_i3:131-2182(+)